MKYYSSQTILHYDRVCYYEILCPPDLAVYVIIVTKCSSTVEICMINNASQHVLLKETISLSLPFLHVLFTVMTAIAMAQIETRHSLLVCCAILLPYKVCIQVKLFLSSPAGFIDWIQCYSLCYKKKIHVLLLRSTCCIFDRRLSFGWINCSRNLKLKEKLNS